MTAGFRSLADIVRKRARTDPANDALIDPIRGVSLTWAELDRRRRMVANLLQSSCEPAARVATVLPICSVAAELVFATASAGLILVPVNERLTAHELAFVFGDAEVSAVITTADHVDAVREAVAMSSPAAAVYVLDPAAGDAESLSYDAAVAGASDREPLGGCTPDNVAMLIYTSGTTGRPKGVMLTHGNFLSSASNYLTDSFAPGDGVYLACVPFSHVGCVVHLAAAMRGLTLVVTPFAPDRILALIERHRVTHIAMVPTMIALVLNVDDTDRYNCASLRRVLYAAAPMPVPLLRRAITRFGPILEQFYGLTESTGLVTILRSDEHLVDIDAGAEALSRLASCGKEATGVWVDVVGPDGHPVATGQPGEIVIRGPGVMAGYWRNEAATAETIRRGWLHSGDLGCRDAAGFVTIVDRLKDVIITGGSNVYPKEVELVLQTVDGVSEASVVGVAHDVWGEIVTAVVVCESGREVPEEVLVTVCQSELAPYKQPRVIRYADALPKNAMGKVDKVALRASLATAGRPEPVRSQ